MPAPSLPLATLRIIGGAGLLLGVAAFGYFGLSLWVLPVLALIFTVSYGLGKWRAWVLAYRTATLGKAIAGQGVTYPVQLVLVAILYFIGRGVGSLAGVGPADAGLSYGDWLWVAGFAAFASVVGLLLVALERRAQAGGQKPATADMPDDDALDLDPTPVTEATFWNRHHFTNKDHVHDEGRETRLAEERAFLNEDQIAAQELRLGIALPARLRRLYGLQNGGDCMSLWVPCDKAMTNAVGGWINTFSGYDSLSPLTAVEPLFESISAYASADEQPEMFPEGSKAMFTLAQWYRETLFLDYRGGGAPRVGFVDFDQFEDLSTGAWEQDALWWDDFDTFFGQLRAEVDR